MTASRSILLAAMALAACGNQNGPSKPKGPVPSPEAASVAPEVPAASLPEPGDTDPKSPQAAATLVERYYAFLEARNYARAYRLWGARGQGSGKTLADFRAEMAEFADYHAEVGAPGDSEGAAGSIYVEVPVHVYGHRKDGSAIDRRGKVTLRRVNDVPGSSEAQRRWHLESIDLPG